MRYVLEEIVQPSISSNLWQKSFLANSIFDPDTGASTRQPLGHDQWANFYHSYQVLSSRIRCTLTPTNQGTTTPGSSVTPLAYHFGIFPRLAINSGSITDVWTVMESGLAKYRTVRHPNANTASRGTSISATFSARRAFNYTDAKDVVDNLGATFGQHPVELYNYDIFIANPTKSNFGGTVTSQFFLTTSIDFLVLLFEPKELTAS